jgi:hypothetical protein
MIISQQHNDAIVSGTASAPASFQILDTPEAFEILSKSIYGDPIRAIIRELSCNAWDSHVEAGKPTEPFEVHLPTQYVPIFTIKDYGTGLPYAEGGCIKCKASGKVEGNLPCNVCNGTGNYDAVTSLYCTYFSSSKTETNHQMGMFGLGSKSPFAYGQTRSGGFTVTNRYYGHTHIYTAMVKNGFPTVVKMQTIDTPGALNGLEVAFPVTPKDIWEFENKAAMVFEFFEPKPKLNKPVVIQAALYSVKTDLWGMRQDDSNTGLRAIQGNVQYTVGNIDISRLTEAQQKLVSMPIDLFFNIGDLRPAVSREALQLDDITINNILKRLDIVQIHLMKEIKKQVDACKTGWEARLKIHELSMQSGIGSIVDDAFNKGLLFGKYTGFKLNSAKVAINELDYNNVILMQYSKTDYKRRKAAKGNLFSTDAARVTAFRDIAFNVSKKSDYDIPIAVGEHTIFVLNDLKTAANKYINYMLQTDPVATFSKAFVVLRANKTVTMDRAMKEALVMLDRIGNPPVIKASELKAKYDPMMKEEKAQKVVKRVRMKVLCLNRYVSYTRRGSGWKKAWSNGEERLDLLLLDPTMKKFYIRVEGREAISCGCARDFIEQVNMLRDSKLFPEFLPGTCVFGIKATSPLLQDASFVELMPYLKAEMKKMLTPAKEMELTLAVNPFNSEWAFILDHIAEHPNLLSLDSPIRQFALVLHQAKQANQDGHSTFVSVAQRLGFSINNTANYNQVWAEVIKQYPMLDVCTRRYSRHDTIEVIDIVMNYLRYADEQIRKTAVVPIDGLSAYPLPGSINNSFETDEVETDEEEEIYA